MAHMNMAYEESNMQMGMAFFHQRPRCCVLQSQTTRNLDTCACRPGIWEWGDTDHIPEGPGAGENKGLEKGTHGIRWLCLILGRPTWVGLLSVPVWSNEIRLGRMNGATGGYNRCSKPWLPHSERGCQVSFPGGLQTDTYSPQKMH